MWKLLIHCTLLIVFCMFIIALYRYNINKITLKKKVIEKFLQKYDENNKEPVGYSREDFAIYSKIMGIYKHKLGKTPTSAELFKCYEKIKSNELTFEKLQSAMDEHGHDYQTHLYPELSYLKVENESINDNESINVEYEDETLVTEEKENPTCIKDDVKNQYILHRPTIYNISNKIIEGEDFDTEKFIRAVKNKVKTMDNEEADSDSELDEFDTQQTHPTVDTVESAKRYPNRCGTKKEMDNENMLARKKESRNLEELEMGCNVSKIKGKLAHKFDDMVLRHDQLWKMPERSPPVCTMNSKKKCPVTPIEVQSSLLGTILDESKNTQVGSILPKFSFKEKN